MARPRVINPNGKTRRIGVTVSEPVVKKLESEARQRGVTFSQIVRERLGA